MSKEENKVETTEEVVEMTTEELLGIPGAESIITGDEKKPSIFSKGEADLSFIDENKEESDNIETKEEGGDIKTNDEEIEDPLAPGFELENTSEAESSSDFKTALKSLSEEGLILPYDDDENFESIKTSEDIKELFKANMESKYGELSNMTQHQFFESQPPEIQVAMKYVADGGQDLKALFNHLSRSEEVRALNVENENDQEEIVRSYLEATKFGNTEEINEEIDSWKDLDRLKSKAEKFKPKLDKMQEEIVNQRLIKQEQLKKQQEATVQQYRDNIYETLKSGELNGLKLDNTVQSKLFSGLIQPSYQSITGKNTNQLGYLLEKYQFVEPRHDLVAEALWLLSDPDGYKNKIKEIGSTNKVEETVRNLKTVQQSKDNSTEAPNIADGRKRTVAKPSKNFFKR
jgi:hypothetical protein